MSTVPVLTTDVAILGAGTAGLHARRAAEAAGARVLLIDPGPFGTTCAREGCMPSKLLIAAADAAHHAQTAHQMGVFADIRVDGAAVLRRVRAERDRFVGFVTESTDALRESGKLLVGRGVVTAPGRLTVFGDNDAPIAFVAFRSLVVATGSVPIVPPPYRGLGSRLWGPAQLFEQATLPARILVVGAGVIGLELGQALHRLGAAVTILGLDHAVGVFSDPLLQDEARRVFGAALDLHAHHTDLSVSNDEDGVSVAFTDSAGQRHQRTVDAVLCAVGRAPNVRGLGLDALGAHLPARGPLPIDPETLQWGDLPLFVAGDANGDRPLLHEAADEGTRAGQHAASWPTRTPAPRKTSLAIVFTEPQMAIVGASYRAQEGTAFAAGQVDYRRQGRARVMGVNEGCVRIYADVNTRQLTGAEMFGPGVEHTAHLLAWCVDAGFTVDRVLQMPFYHPVLEEGIRTALESLRDALDAHQRAA